jgi:hypothetical protein
MERIPDREVNGHLVGRDSGHISDESGRNHTPAIPRRRLRLSSAAFPAWPNYRSAKPYSWGRRLHVEVYASFSREALELIGKEGASRFCDPTHPILVPGFRKRRVNEFFGNLLSNQPVESSRVLVTAHVKHLEDEAAYSNFLRGWQAVVWRPCF